MLQRPVETSPVVEFSDRGHRRFGQFELQVVRDRRQLFVTVPGSR
ncbi:MAG: hypothetical protein NXI31_09765 [bacterium]|nr:hypothetical protein [bacterium]